MNKSLVFVLFCFAVLIVFYNDQIFEFRNHKLDSDFSGYQYEAIHDEKKMPADRFFLNQDAQSIKIDDSGRRIFYLKNNKLYFFEDGEVVLVVNDDNKDVLDYSVSNNGSLVAYIYKVKSKSDNLSYVMLWEEGLSDQELISQPLEGIWSISASKNGEMILVYPVDQSRNVHAKIIKLNPMMRSSHYPNEYLMKRKRDFFVLPVEGISSAKWADIVDNNTLVSIQRDKDGSIVKKQALVFRDKLKSADIDSDGTDDLLLFENSQDLPIWRAKTLGHMDGPSKKQTSERSKFNVWRLGDGGGIPLTGDFDGDRYLDFATFTPNFLTEKLDSKGNWQLFLSAGSSLLRKGSAVRFSKTMSLSWGFGSHFPLVADFDGDGKSDIITFDREFSTWHFLFSGGGFNINKALKRKKKFGFSFQWGLPGDYPMLGDLNGDGQLDLIVCSNPKKEREPLNWRVKLIKSVTKTNKNLNFDFGKAGDVPFIGDFNGDGREEPAVYEPDNGRWRIRYSTKNEGVKEDVIDWTIGGAYPIVGDFDGDGVTDFAFFSTKTVHRWYILSSIFKDKAAEIFPSGRTVVTDSLWGKDFENAIPPQLFQRRFFGFKN